MLCMGGEHKCEGAHLGVRGQLCVATCIYLNSPVTPGAYQGTFDCMDSVWDIANANLSIITDILRALPLLLRPVLRLR